jgi:uncharacterized protein (DUF4213/DUF364 family)
MVLDETLEILRALYGKELDITRIEKIVFGIFFTGVKLSDGSGGVAYTPTTDLHSATCCPSMAAERPAPVLLKGMTVEDLLRLTGPGANVLVTGPTASILPEALFARNANIVSGVEVTDPDLTIDLLSEGVGAYHLFNRCVRKINILKN